MRFLKREWGKDVGIVYNEEKEEIEWIFGIIIVVNVGMDKIIGFWKKKEVWKLFFFLLYLV